MACLLASTGEGTDTRFTRAVNSTVGYNVDKSAEYFLVMTAQYIMVPTLLQIMEPLIRMDRIAPYIL